MSLYIYNKGKKLKCGYTTGSCAAAAAKAAALMLENQSAINTVTIATPADIPLTLDVQSPSFNKDTATCSIIKDAGDDHDATDGISIFAVVTRRSDDIIQIQGGEGIGRITKSGFWGKAGESAINPVPRKMITDAVSSVADGGWDIVISAPEGEKIAANTLNAKLGILDGISIIGTSGIVEPMSLEAMKQTIYLEIDDIAKSGDPEILLFLGNYGQQVAKTENLSAPSVKISNFIGDAVLYCKNKSFQKVTLIGHIGKLSKLSIGAFYTHSSANDLRMEAFVYYLALEGAPTELVHQVSVCTDSEEALKVVQKNHFGQIVDRMHQGCLDRVRKYVKDPEFNIEIIIYSMEQGILK